MQHLWDAILVFLDRNLTFVIGWFVVLMATAILNPVISHRLRRTSEKRDEHLVELKQEVLQPILGYLSEHMTPILEHRRGNVGLSRRSVPQSSAGIMQVPTKYVESFRFQEASEPPITSPYLDRADDIGPVTVSQGPLYHDARRNHFRESLRKWEKLVASFQAYNVSCQEYVEKLRSGIAQATSIPEYHPDSIVQGRWIDTGRLALFVFYRQLGLMTHQFSRTSHAGFERLSYQNSYTVAEGSTEEINKVQSKLDALIAKRDEFDLLTSRARAVNEDALTVRAEVEQLLFVRRFRGRCRHLA